MKIKKVEKAFNKMIQEEIGPDGYVTIDKVEIDPDGQFIKIKGGFGECSENRDGDWREDYELEYADGKSLEFLKGMFYRVLDVYLMK